MVIPRRLADASAWRARLAHLGRYLADFAAG